MDTRLLMMQKDKAIEERDHEVFRLMRKLEELKTAGLDRTERPNIKPNQHRFDEYAKELHKHGLKSRPTEDLLNECTIHLAHIHYALVLYNDDDFRKLDNAAAELEVSTTYDLRGLRKFAKAIREIRMDVLMR